MKDSVHMGDPGYLVKEPNFLWVDWFSSNAKLTRCPVGILMT